MKQKIIHIGLDVDDTRYHGTAFNKETGEVVDFDLYPRPVPLTRLDFLTVWSPFCRCIPGGIPGVTCAQKAIAQSVTMLRIRFDGHVIHRI